VDDAERFRLHFGPYATPRFRYGQVAWCEVRGEVSITRLTDAPIPWPVGKRGRAKSLVVCKGLDKAVRRESAQAVAHWWGVTPQTVTVWRKALGVERTNEGTYRLFQEHGRGPAGMGGLAKAWAKAQDPARREKIAAARRGQPRPARVVEAVRRAHLGTGHSEQTRRKMSEAHRRLGHRPPVGQPWTPAEDDMVRTLPPADVVRRTGRSLRAVYDRRRTLGLPDGRRR
jgi:hypothetical protein